MTVLRYTGTAVRVSQGIGKGGGIAIRLQGLHLVAQFRIGQVEFENQILQGGSVEVSQFLIELVDFHSRK